MSDFEDDSLPGPDIATSSDGEDNAVDAGCRNSGRKSGRSRGRLTEDTH